MRVQFHRIAALLVLPLVSAACSMTGSGRSKTEERTVAPFDAVTVSHSLMARISVVAAQPQRVEISGDDNLVSLVQATVAGSELTLSLPADTSFTTKLPLVATVSAQALHALKADSSALAVADALSGDDVVVASSSSAEVTVTNLAAGKSLTLASDSSATVTVGGATPLLKAEVTNSANLHAQDLSAASAVIRAANAANAHLCATGSLDATLSNSSQVGYQCNPASVVENVDQTSALTKD